MSNFNRGLHFQTKHTQGKLVRLTDVAVYDVAVDLRKGSPTYGMWQKIESISIVVENI